MAAKTAASAASSPAPSIEMTSSSSTPERGLAALLSVQTTSCTIMVVPKLQNSIKFSIWATNLLLRLGNSAKQSSQVPQTENPMSGAS
jgi:hypothetical protein